MTGVQTCALPILGGEDGEGDTAGEAHHDGVGNEADDGAQFENAHQQENDARHDSGDGQSFDAVLLDDAVHDDDERAGGTSDLHAAATQGQSEKG